MLIHFTLSFSNALSLFPVSIITHSLFYSLPLPLLPSLLIGGGQRGSRPSVYCNLTPALTSWTLQEEAGRYIPTPTYFFTLKQWFTTIIHKYSNHHTPRWFDNRLEKLAKILISFTFMDLGVWVCRPRALSCHCPCGRHSGTLQQWQLFTETHAHKLTRTSNEVTPEA